MKYERRSRRDVEKTEDLDRDLRNASNYGLSLLPAPLLTGPVRTEWLYFPSAQLGGDAFGYYWLDPNTFVFYLIDVSDHGVGAAMHRGAELPPALLSRHDRHVLKGGFRSILRLIEYTADWKWLEALRRGFHMSNRSLDTMDLTLHLEKGAAFSGGPPIRHFTLDALCEMFGVIPHGRHTAGGDAFITAQVFLRLLRLASRCGRETLGRLSETVLEPA